MRRLDYVYYAFGALVGWAFGLYLRTAPERLTPDLGA